MICIRDRLYKINNFKIETFEVVNNVNSGKGYREFILRNLLTKEEFPCKENNINDYCKNPQECEKRFKISCSETEKNIFNKSLMQTITEHENFLIQSNCSKISEIAETI